MKHYYIHFLRNIRIEITSIRYPWFPTTVTFFSCFFYLFWFTDSIFILLLTYKQKKDPIFQSSTDTMIFLFEFLFFENNGNKELHLYVFSPIVENENYMFIFFIFFHVIKSWMHMWKCDKFFSLKQSCLFSFHLALKNRKFIYII